MKFQETDFEVVCGCRSVGECHHNDSAWGRALEGITEGFRNAMLSKLRRKAVEGKSGWDDPDWTKEQILEALKEHVEKGDMVDVANFAMFLWNRN